jgi:heterodisulfide reductase subunit A-like polyferredoxin
MDKKPGFMDLLKNSATAAARAAGAISEGKELKVSDEEKEKRLAICNSCPHKEELIGQPRCGACGCFLKLKASLATEKCPKDKW